MRQRGESVKGFGVDQSDTIIGDLASTLNYLDYLSIIYRDRSQKRGNDDSAGRVSPAGRVSIVKIYGVISM
jgi:hypothetical protein